MVRNEENHTQQRVNEDAWRVRAHLRPYHQEKGDAHDNGNRKDYQGQAVVLLDQATDHTRAYSGTHHTNHGQSNVALPVKHPGESELQCCRR